MSTFQRVTVQLEGGNGTVTISPDPNANGLYEIGTLVTVTIIVDSGYVFEGWRVRSQIASTNTTYSFTISRSDVRLVAVISGNAINDFTYGLKYFAEYVDDQDRKSIIRIEEKNFTGTAEKVDIANPVYSIGNFDSRPTEIFVTSNLSWSFIIEKNNRNFDDILTLDPRQFRVTWYRNYISDSVYDFIWIGYLKTAFLSNPEYRSTYFIDVIATDGIKDLEGFRTVVEALDFNDASDLIARLINQTFKDGLPIRESVRIFEDRMNPLNSVFDQFTVNRNHFYEGDLEYQRETDLVIYNPGKTVLRSIESMVKSFVTRVYQWNGYWYITRIWEFTKDEFKYNEFNAGGLFQSSFTLPNNQEIECIGNVERYGEVSFTEFNALLKLGSIDRPELEEILVESFNNDSWYNPGQRPTRGGSIPVSIGYTLLNWEYVNAFAYIENQDREGEFSGVRRLTEDDNNYINMYSTANTLSDPLLSYLEYNNIIRSAVKGADVISINLIFRVRRRSPTLPLLAPVNSHEVAIMVKIGNFYLSYDGDVTFTWVENTETYVVLPVTGTNVNVWNNLDINNLEVPTDGLVEFRLCQLVTKTGFTRHRYNVQYDDIKVALSRNDALEFTEIRAKSIANENFTNIFDEYETYIGDALTNLSSSAILMKDEEGIPVSNTWGREEIQDEQDPLLGVILQDLVNIYAKNNYTFTGNIKESDAGVGIDFRKAITYKGRRCVPIAAKLDDRSGIWDIQYFDLAPIVPEPIQPLISWANDQLASGIVIDSNIRIFVGPVENETLIVEEFANSNGSFSVNLGDRVRVQYFILAGESDPSAVNPRLQFLKDGLLLGDHAVDINVESTFNFAFFADTENISILVRTIQDG